MKTTRRFISAFTIAASLAGPACADEDAMFPGPAQMPAGYSEVVEKTAVPACTSDHSLIETSFQIEAHDEMIRRNGGMEIFRTHFGRDISDSLQKMIHEAVETRTAERAVLAAAEDFNGQTNIETSMAAELLSKIEHIVAPYERKNEVRILVRLDTVRIIPRAC